MLKILGVRPHAPRSQQYVPDTMELPMTIYLFNDEVLSFDRGDNSINSFLSFLDSKKIPLIHYWDGMFYQSPDQKCFRWYYNNRSQGRLFANSQIDALKRIQKRGQYLPESMQDIRVEEVEFSPYQHFDIPEWIINNTPEH